MFTSVSWQQYIIFISITAVVYYTYILLKYHTNEVINFIKRTKKISFVSEEKKNTKTIATVDANVNQLLEELKILFQLASKGNYSKEELMVSLQLKLREYNQFQNTSFEMVVNNFMARESESICSIHLVKEDIDKLWFR